MFSNFLLLFYIIVIYNSNNLIQVFKELFVNYENFVINIYSYKGKNINNLGIFTFVLKINLKLNIKKSIC